MLTINSDFISKCLCKSTMNVFLRQTDLTSIIQKFCVVFIRNKLASISIKTNHDKVISLIKSSKDLKEVKLEFNAHDDLEEAMQVISESNSIQTVEISMFCYLWNESDQQSVIQFIQTNGFKNITVKIDLIGYSDKPNHKVYSTATHLKIN
uniref:Uncharacterized protein n=1 Tax=Euplotes harpa TaxID=151035 RepID=A0A7S3J357_9SPIT|mmetsp:Transcript_17188/g.19877  ORF Transcript_17188/g.19877 Transcript_17188/m.19877 type:complete len:151 (+) Transcript_17188:415-867(+)